ncbi:MAG: TspO/MBR family protein [Flavobacteriaceae bacterium]|jgi:tryptophan-rich sensory protein
MKFALTFIFFLGLNFGALFLGNVLMNNGATSDWYLNLNKAPWTPAGWVFGAAWTSVMLFFSVYMTFLYQNLKTQKVILLYSLHLLFNISWNFIFMNKHMIILGLIDITLLTILMFYFLIAYNKILNNMRFFVLPYCIWLLIATSLNLFIVINN